MISVIIPCYNFGHLVADTIQSLRQQTYSDIEIIIINDGSKDNTIEVVTSLASTDSRIKCFSFPNTGLGASRNRGLEIAKGDFIQFLDADDLLEKRKFEKQLELFASAPDVDIVYGSVRYFSNDPYNPKDRLLTYWGVNKEWMPNFSGNGKTLLPIALKGNFSHLSSTLFRKSIVDKVGLFDNEISAVADYHFLIRCAIQNANFLYNDTPETYSLVRWHPSNMSKDKRMMFSKELEMRRKLIPLLKDNTEASTINFYGIKSRELELEKSWKRVFLSGGKFDFLKKFVAWAGLQKVVLKIFYGSK